MPSSTPRTTAPVAAQRTMPIRRLAAVSALTLALGAAAFAIAPPAHAHNYVVSTTPGENETLTELPAEFSVTTNEDMLDVAGDGSGFALQIVDADGRHYGDGCVTVSGPSISTAAAIGEPGDYELLYQYVSADGHTLSGSLPFVWAPEGPVTTSIGRDAPPVCGAEPEAVPSEEPATPEPSPTPPPVESESPAAEPDERPTTPDDATDSDEAGISTAARVALIVGGIGVVAVLGAVVFLLLRKARAPGRG